MPHTIPRIAITPGEPAGIGPDLVLQLAMQQCHSQNIIIADPALLETRARELGLNITLRRFDADEEPAPCRPGALYYLPIKLNAPVRTGITDPANANYVLKTLDRAIEGCGKGDFDALVTGPVHKGVINDAGIPFTGHTEYLATRSGTPRVVMMLVTKGLRVALVTTHLPLSQVAAAISQESLSEVITVLNTALQTHFNIKQPRIRVLGLNPHAGENGHLGKEEIELIIPVLETLRGQGYRLEGPVPADTAFTPCSLVNTDVVLAMYHDQGLPVLKHLGFGKAVNITLGLPFIRTSVDHGTALELAGSGQASSDSLLAALAQAVEMVNNNA